MGEVGKTFSIRREAEISRFSIRKWKWLVRARLDLQNIRHSAGGGDVKIHDEKVEFRVGSRVGSLANVKHRAGGGEKKIFDDKKYLRQSQADGGLSRSMSSSRASSVMGSTSALEEKSGTLKRVKKVTPPTPTSSSSYSSQILR